MGYGTCQEERKVHHQSKEHRRCCQAPDEQAKTNKEFSKWDNEVEHFYIRKCKAVKEGDIPAIYRTSIRSHDRVCYGIFYIARCIKAVCKLVKSCRHPRIPEIKPQQSKKDCNTYRIANSALKIRGNHTYSNKL